MITLKEVQNKFYHKTLLEAIQLLIITKNPKKITLDYHRVEYGPYSEFEQLFNNLEDKQFVTENGPLGTYKGVKIYTTTKKADIGGKQDGQ